MGVVGRLYYILPEPLRAFSRATAGEVLKRIAPARMKKYGELNYWFSRKRDEGILTNHHYEYFYTEHFNLTVSDYTGKRILDIGCGPRGSLEWASMTDRRVGVDPLANSYLELVARNQAMEYVEATAEALPFDDGYFDVVASFNSLDHVDDLEGAVREIKRVLKPGGLFLLLSDVGHRPTICEPQSYSWEIVDAFGPELAVEDVRHLEKADDGGIYRSIYDARPFDHANTAERYGILSARFRKADPAPT